MSLFCTIDSAPPLLGERINTCCGAGWPAWGAAKVTTGRLWFGIVLIVGAFGAVWGTLIDVEELAGKTLKVGMSDLEVDVTNFAALVRI